MPVPRTTPTIRAMGVRRKRMKRHSGNRLKSRFTITQRPCRPVSVSPPQPWTRIDRFGSLAQLEIQAIFLMTAGVADARNHVARLYPIADVDRHGLIVAVQRVVAAVVLEHGNQA